MEIELWNKHKYTIDNLTHTFYVLNDKFKYLLVLGYVILASISYMQLNYVVIILSSIAVYFIYKYDIKFIAHELLIGNIIYMFVILIVMIFYNMTLLEFVTIIYGANLISSINGYNFKKMRKYNMIVEQDKLNNLMLDRYHNYQTNI